jgi:hypothetical protein
VVAELIGTQLGSPSKGRPYAAKLIESFLVECQGVGEPPDLALERLLPVEHLREIRDGHLLEALMMAFFWYRTHRLSLWHEVGGAFLLRSSQLKKLRRVVGRYRAVAGTDFVFHSCSGALAVAAGDLATAAIHFRDGALAVPPDAYMGWLVRSGVSVRNPWEMATELLDAPNDTLTTLNGTEVHGGRRADAPSVLMSCESRYFDRFAPAVTTSLVSSGFRGNILFACVNADSFNLDTVEGVVSVAHTAGASVTLLDYPYHGRDLAAFSASVRFFAALDCLDQGFADLYIGDIDFNFTPEILAEIEQERNNPAFVFSLTKNRLGRTLFPSMAIAATSSGFKNNPESRFFLERVQRYVEVVLETNANNWFIDQVALFAAWKLYALTAPHDRTGDFQDLRNRGNAISSEQGVLEFKRQTRGSTTRY